MNTSTCGGNDASGTLPEASVSRRELAARLRSAGRPVVIVVGDVMLDRYYWGRVDRTSPEAPVPIVTYDREEQRLGGAGSVASMVSALGGIAVLVSVVGNDADGDEVRRVAASDGIKDRTTASKARRTTVKTRIMGAAQGRHIQQIVRLDREIDVALSSEDVSAVLKHFNAALAEADVVIISDYGKGVCTPNVVRPLLTAARQRNVPVLADPSKHTDYPHLAGCEAITPNRFEAAIATGVDTSSQCGAFAAAKKMQVMGIRHAIVTVDRDGMIWAGTEGRCGYFNSHARQVYDVTGAGDMAISALAIALAEKWPYEAAITFANFAAGAEVERHGASAIPRNELVQMLDAHPTEPSSKVVTLPDLLKHTEAHRRRGERIVMTNGCFDLLHAGHLACLRFAHRQGNCLVVAVNSDRSVSMLKGVGRPIISATDRMELLAAIEFVNYVVEFDNESVRELVREIRPDVLVKASQYTSDEVIGADIIRGYGGTIALAPYRLGVSTSEICSRLRCEPIDRDQL